MRCIISYQNVAIKYNTRLSRKYLQQKYQIVSRIIKDIKKLFFFLCIYKMALLWEQRYNNAGAIILKIIKTGAICKK